jgi:expansin (peptidoglycan-binding protein)
VGTGGGGSGGRAGTGGGGGSGGRVGTGGGGSGGRAGTGGGSGSGGRVGSGGSGSGGAGPTTCNVGPATNGNGSFTQYWFSQGTGMENGGFRLACGYFGTGQGGDGRSDMVQNIANPRQFAAIPARSPTDFNSVGYCGACAEVTGANGSRAIVTIVDMCPQSSNPICNGNPSGHLDLSVSTMDMLGFPRRDPSNTTWRFVPCPVTGNVIVRIKQGNQNELFVENTRVPIRSVEWNGTQASRTSYGAWHYNSNLTAGSTLIITDTSNRVLTYTLAHANQNVNQDTGYQFPQCL